METWGGAGEQAGRWERLFGDVEAEYESEARRELTAEVADRTRREVATLRLVDRLRPALGSRLEFTVAGTGAVSGVPRDMGPDWVLVAESRLGTAVEAVIALAHVETITGLAALSAEPGSEGHVAARLDIRHAVRRVARDRTPVRLALASGALFTGTIDRVGADYLELAEHAVDEPRRARTVRTVRTVALSALALIRPGRY